MKALFNFLEINVSKPGPYGWFHILCMVLIVAATVVLCVKCKDCDDKTFRLIALITWATMFLLEIYKQIVFTYDYTDSGITADYQWYAFPFQLCASPLYVLPFVALMKDGKVRDYFVSFISTFAMFGGLVVFFYPYDVFINVLGINVQTMIHHGGQIIIGIFFAVHERKKLNFTYFLKSIAVFVALVLIAFVLNELVYIAFQNRGMDETFNMFYISRHFPNHLPLLSTIYASVSYVVFLVVYVFGFTVLACAVFYAIIGCIKLVNYLKERHKNA